MIRWLLVALAFAAPANAEDQPRSFPGGAEDVVLAGSLLQAPALGAPAFVIVSGSGLQDRDFNHQGEQIFRRLAWKCSDAGTTLPRLIR